MPVLARRAPFGRRCLRLGALRGLLLGIAASLLSIAAAEACPLPTVIVPASTDAPALASMALDALLDANAGEVRFVSASEAPVQTGSLDEAYLLEVEVAEPDAARPSLALQLTDPRGARVVRAAASGDPDAMDAADLERALALQVASDLTPLRAWIRAHQRTLRDAHEGIAIAAHLHATPGALTLAPGDAATVALDVIDCDGTPLAGREVLVAVRGVGRVEPAVLVSDATGSAGFGYVSEIAGEGWADVRHRFERPEGGSGLAEALVEVLVTDAMPGEPTPGSDALVEVTTSAEGVTVHSRMVSCGGLGGTWDGVSTLTFELPEVRGTLEAEGSFTFPAEPAPDARTDASWSLGGVLLLPDVGGDVDFTGSWSYGAVLRQVDGVWYLEGEGGSASGSVVATIPEVGRITIPMAWPIDHGPPAPVRFVDLEACHD